MAMQTHIRFARAKQFRQATVGKSFLLQRAQLVLTNGFQGAPAQTLFGQYDVFDLSKKPRVDLRQIEELFTRITFAERLAHVPDALGTRIDQLLVEIFTVRLDLVESI